MMSDLTDKNQAIHVCLISKQTLPNLLPLLQERPGGAIFLVTEQMGAQTERLRRLAERNGIWVKEEKIPPYGIAEVGEVCSRLLESYGPERLTLNVTGGTKLGALAAFEAFYAESGTRIIYVNTDEDCLQTLWPQEGSQPLPDLLTVADYLTAYGAEIRAGSGQEPAGMAGRARATAKLARLLTDDPELLQKLNGKASPFVSDRQQPPKPYLYLTPADFPNPDQAAVLFALLKDSGLASDGVDGGVNVNRKNRETREEWFYLGGGWLEEFVYQEVAKIGVRDLRINVKVGWGEAGRVNNPGQRGASERPGGSGRNGNRQANQQRHSDRPENEFDILFTHRNRLHVISCKASNPDHETAAGTTRATEAIHELDSLATKAGGLYGQAMLVSARKLRDADLQRAKEQKIEVVHGRDLPQLGAALRQWLHHAESA